MNNQTTLYVTTVESINVSFYVIFMPHMNMISWHMNPTQRGAKLHPEQQYIRVQTVHMNTALVRDNVIRLLQFMF